MGALKTFTKNRSNSEYIGAVKAIANSNITHKVMKFNDGFDHEHCENDSP
jgi:hypothetical protein